MSRRTRYIWHADVVIDTSAVSRAGTEEGFRKLASLLDRMTKRKEYGKAWLPTVGFSEMLVTESADKLAGLLEGLKQLHKRLGDRFQLLCPLPLIIEHEWQEPPSSCAMEIGQLLPEIEQAARQRSLSGTRLDLARADFMRWRDGQKTSFEESMQDWTTAYQEQNNDGFRNSVDLALKQWKLPDAYDACDDLALALIKQDAKQADPTAALTKAKAEPKRYLATWTFALLARITQFSRTLPPDVRAKRYGGLAKVLKPHENDFTDAAIAACGARCGTLIANDRGLRDRVNHLADLNLIRLQAGDLDFIANCWRPPGQQRGRIP